MKPVYQTIVSRVMDAKDKGENTTHHHAVDGYCLPPTWKIRLCVQIRQLSYLTGKFARYYFRFAKGEKILSKIHYMRTQREENDKMYAT